MAEPHYIFYGSAMSLYSGKLRSYMRKKELSFHEVLPNDPDYLANVAPRVGGAYQPTILTPDDEAIRDSSVIIDTLEARHPENPITPPGSVQQLVSLLFELFGDEGLLKPAMHYRWIDPKDHTKWCAPQDDDDYVARWFIRFADPRSDQSPHDQAQLRMQRIIDTTLLGLGVTADTVHVVEEAFEDFLRLFATHLERYPYLLGGKPCLGDFALMGPLYAHMGRDPVPSALIKTIAPAVFDWTERMNAAEAGLSMHPGVEPAFLPDDKIPDTLVPLIKMMTGDFMPEVAGTMDFLTDWLEHNGPVAPGTPVMDHRLISLGILDPIGHHRVPLRGVTLDLAVRHYVQWMFQRVQDCYLSMDAPARKHAADILGGTGILTYLETPVKRRIERVDNVEVFA